MTDDDLKLLVKQQFAADYNCSIYDFDNKQTLVTRICANKDARKNKDESILNVLIYDGKLIINASDQLYDWCNTFLVNNMSAQWGMEIDVLRKIDDKLRDYSHKVNQVHIQLLPKYDINIDMSGVSYELMGPDEIINMKTDERIDEAFLYDDSVENRIDDMIGVKIVSDSGNMLAVAGASNNGSWMWEMGCNSFCPGKGYAQLATAKLINEVKKLGKVPYAGTAISHLASQNTMLRAGMLPAFCEFRTK